MQQCEALRTSLEARFTAETDIAVIASPMRRTLQTAQLALPWLLERGVRIQADADWQGEGPNSVSEPVTSRRERKNKQAILTLPCRKFSQAM